MRQRVFIDANGVFRVSVAGVDAQTAEFGNLIFDGNQPPLRLSQNGFFSMPMILDSEFTAPSPQTIAEAAGPFVLVVPPNGSTPIFMVMHRTPFTVPQGANSVATNFPGEVLTPAAIIGGLQTMPVTSLNGNPTSGQAGNRGSGGAICNGSRFFGMTYTPNTFQVSMFPQGNTFNFVFINYAIFKNFN
jgi:hypothetical protein